MSQLGRAPLTYLEEDLGRTLAETHGSTNAVELARDLIGRDREPLELLGVVDGGGQALFWHHLYQDLARVPLDGADMEPICEPWLDPPARTREDLLVRSESTEWAWLHPRQRWRIDDE